MGTRRRRLFNAPMLCCGRSVTTETCKRSFFRGQRPSPGSKYWAWFVTDSATSSGSCLIRMLSNSSTLQAALEFCLQKVSRKNRDVLTAFYAEGRSVREIAEAAGRGQSAVKMLLMRLRKRLEKCIEIQLVKGNSA